MKILITNYTFDASAKTVTFNDYGSIVLDGVLLIANVTDNIIIYNFASPAKGGSVATNVLTLTYDTTSMSDTDDLLIYYDDPAATQEITVSSLPLPTGAATAAAQLPDGHNVTVDNVGGVEVVQDTAADLNATVVGTVTANLGTIADVATQTTLAAINTKLVTGTDIGDVTINNGAGAAAVNIQDGGNIITVDGTVTANLSATDNGVLDQIELNQDSQTTVLGTIDADTGAIKTAVETIDNAISGSEMQVDVVAALPAGTNIIGKVNVNYLVAKTRTIYDVDASAVQIYDCSADADIVAISVCNSGDFSIGVGSSSVTLLTADYKLVSGQSIPIPVGYVNGSTLNDLYAIRASAATNDNVVVVEFRRAA